MIKNIEEVKKTAFSQSKTEDDCYRLNLTLNRESRLELETLKNASRKSTLADVIRTALALLKIVTEHQSSGGRVVFRNPDNSEETLRLL